jgi:hypothetical protein
MNLDTLDNLNDLDAQIVEYEDMIRTFTREGQMEQVAEFKQALATCKAAFAEMLATI